MRCDYCGAVFKEEHDNLIILEHPKIVPVYAEALISNEIVQYDGSVRLVKDLLTEKLAEEIAKYMDIIVQDLPQTCQKAVRGRVRIVPPGTRF